MCIYAAVLTQCVDNVESSNSLALGMLSVGDRVADNVYSSCEVVNKVFEGKAKAQGWERITRPHRMA